MPRKKKTKLQQNEAPRASARGFFGRGTRPSKSAVAPTLLRQGFGGPPSHSSVKLDPKSRAKADEEKGDKYLKKKNFKKALQSYRKVLELDENYLPVYDKLIEAHTKIKSEWSDRDFSDSLSWTMKKQELENPQLKRIHAQLEPEWKEVSKLIQQLMAAKDEKSETNCVEKIIAHQDKAIYPLIEVILSFKKLGNQMKSQK